MLNKSVRIRPWSRFAASLLIAFNLGSQTADVLAYLRPLDRDTTAARSDPYLLNHVDGFGTTTWDCTQPIEVAVNLRHLPNELRQGTLLDLLAAMEAISSQSSFQLRFVGETLAVPTKSWAQSWKSHSPAAPVVVAFGDTSDTDLFLPNAMAVGGFFRVEDSSGRPRTSVGFVYVHTEHFVGLKEGSGFMSRGALLTHELLHVLGLDHVHHSKWDSVMNPWLSHSWGKLGPGDLEGLERLAEIGCPSKVS
jgi:hypothetical protein